MQRQSLLDGEDFSSIGGRKGGGGKGRAGGGGLDNSKKAKIAIAVVLFVLAGGLLAWNAGLFSGPVREKVTPERKQAREKQIQQDEEELERLQREGKVTVGGA